MINNYKRLLEEVIKPENTEPDFQEIIYKGFCPECHIEQESWSTYNVNVICSVCRKKKHEEKIANALKGAIVKDILIDEYDDFAEIILEKDKKQIKVYIEDYYGEGCFELAYKPLSEDD